MTQTWTCPCAKGVQSTAPDFCSECGDQMAPVPAAAAAEADGTATAVVDLPGAGLRPPTVNPDGTRTCHAPDPAGQGGECGFVNPPGNDFCENCSAPLDAAAAVPAPATSQAPPTQPTPALPLLTPAAPAATVASAVPAGVSAQAPNGWELLVTVNRERAATVRDRAGQPVPVADDRDLCFPIVLAESLVGRRSESHDVYPEIELHDPVVSRPHAMVRKGPDGNLTWLHMSPRSPSVVDGVKLAAGQSAPLRAGSVVRLGAYTDITVRAR